MLSLVLLSILLCMVVGATIDTGSICAVRAARDLSVGKPAVAVGSMLAAACAAIVYYSDTKLGWQLRPTPWAYPTILTFIGAALFALGALINGACAIGTIGRLARGDIGYVATMAGGLVAALVLPHVSVANQKPDLEVTRGVVWLSIVLGMTALAFILTRQHLRASELASFAAIGLIAAILANVQGDWTWLSLVGELRAGVPIRYATIACIAGAVVGAALAARFRHRFRLVWPQPKAMAREAIGGGLMASGAILIPGGNDALIVSGVPSGSPLAITAYMVMFGLMVALLRFIPYLKRVANWN